MGLAKRAIIVGFVTASLAACAHYYKVTEPASGKVFYTQEIKRNGSAVEFKDAQTGGVTTLQNSQITEINKSAYQEGIEQTKK